MGMTKIAIPPGIKSMMGQAGAENSWFASNLIRFQNGLVQRWFGWVRLFSAACSGFVRAMHAYEGLDGVNYLLLGTDTGAQVYNGTALYDLTVGTRTASVLDFGLGAFTITPVAGQAAVTIDNPGNEATVGSDVVISVTFTVGGVLLPTGRYRINTIIDSDHYKIDMPSVALNTNVGDVRTFTFTGSPSPVPLHVDFANHGLSVGDTMVLDLTTYFYADNGVVFVISGGTWTSGATGATQFPNIVTNVISADAFEVGSILIPRTTALTVLEGSWNAGTYGFDPVLGIYASYPAPALLSAPDNWSMDNLGNTALISYEGTTIYSFSPPVPDSGIPLLTNIATGPQINAGMFVTMPQAQIVAYGSQVTIPNGVQDPLLIRWSDVGSAVIWIASSTNQAGSFRLSRGSKIVGGLQGPQVTYLWTDTDAWSMVYIGAPLVYSFQQIGAGCGLISAKSCAVLGHMICWAGEHGFWYIGPNGVEQMPCDVWDYVFGDMDDDYEFKAHMASNADFSEITFYFPSKSGGTHEIDSYVKVNLQGGQFIWDVGRLVRTAWIDKSVFGEPLGADQDFHIQRHEIDYDADGAAIEGAFVETGFFALSEEQDACYLSEFEIPGWKWLGTDGFVRVYFKVQSYPNGPINTYGPFQVTPTTRFFNPHIRGRLVAIRYEWGESLGFDARIGFSRGRIAANGRRG